MKNYKLEEELNKYISEPRNPDYNFGLACNYHNIQQYAAALSYYLRCAELSDNDDLVYECLLLAWDCINKAGDRKAFERGQILQLIAQSPHRPEGYYAMCCWLEYNGEGKMENTEVFNQIYSYACIGISNIANNIEFQYYNGYPGGLALEFYKGFAGWQMGKVVEAENIFIDLYNNHELDKNFKQYVYNNIKNLNIEHRIKKQ